MAGKSALTKTVRDMVLSLGLIGVVIAGFLLIMPRGEIDPVKVVDYRVQLSQVRRVAPYPVLAPVGLSADWKATSVRYSAATAHWHLGFYTPGKQYAAIEQSTVDPAKFIDAESLGATPDGTMEVADQTWQRYQGARYRALVRTDTGTTSMVTGTASYSELAELIAASLRDPSRSGTAPAPSPSR